jgi:pimeloyl-ACP methyl ester carboxylesterase
MLFDKKTSVKTLCLLLILFFGPVSHAQSFKTFASFDGTKIAYTEEGSGTPVLLIHGFISTGDMWNQTILKKELLAHGYRVIVPDLRGNGNSDRPQNKQAYSDDAEIKDMMALAGHLQLDSYFALGYSRGAIVLAKLLTEEKKITKAVLGGMGLDFTNPDWDRRIMFQKAFSGEEPLNDLTKGAVNYANSIGADLRILSFLQEYQPVTSVDQLKMISIPVLVIAGDQDTGNGNPKELQEHIPDASLQMVPGEHNDTYKSDGFSKEIIKFFELK